MKQVTLIIILAISFFKVLSQSTVYKDCELLEDYNKYLWLNNEKLSIVDNALRCFKLNSINTPGDSCMRIWVYENDYPDSPIVHRLKLFEMGIKNDVKYATYNTIEWEEQNEILCKVKCIKKKSIQPLSGWATIEKEIKTFQLNKINTIPIPLHTDDTKTDGNLLFLQYVFNNRVENTDFTSHSDIGKSKYKKIKKFAYLIRLINREFNIKLSVNKRGYDFLNETLVKAVPLTIPEVQLNPVNSLP